MEIMIGSQLVAPNGFQSISQSERVYFVCHCSTRPRVILVSFVFIPKMRVRWHFLGRKAFAAAVTENHQLRVLDSGPGTPGWLINPRSELSHVEELDRLSRQLTHSKIVTARLNKIEPLTVNTADIFEANNPRAEICSRARVATPDQNSGRIVFWLMAFLVFGEIGLQPVYHRIGRWQRPNSGDEPKRGRPSLSAGIGAGSNVDPTLGKQLAEGFAKHAKVGDTWEEVFSAVMRLELKLPNQEIDGGRGGGRREFYDPNGGAVPSRYQFRYWTLQHLTLAQTQIALYGEARHRLDHRASPGSFSASLSQVLERVEADCYYTEEYPQSFITTQALDKLCICRMRCITSGVIVGFGVSFGSENAGAYAMALLCMSMNKVQFCALLGVSIKHEDWPCRGMSPRPITDRGPGAKEIADDGAPIRQIVGSYRPRSKASIESSNPRTKEKKGAPEVEISNLNPIQMIIRELRDAIAFNARRNMSAHASPEIVAAGTVLNPLGLWKFYTERGRSVARSMTKDAAMRKYMEQVPAELHEDGVYLNGQRYCSEPLVKSKYLNKVAVGLHVKINVYIIPMCIKNIWMDVLGELFQLEWQRTAFSYEEQYFLTCVEQKEMERLIKVDESAARTAQAALIAHHNEKLEEETGKKARGGRVVPGRLSGSNKADAESALVRSMTKSKAA